MSDYFAVVRSFEKTTPHSTVLTCPHEKCVKKKREIENGGGGGCRKEEQVISLLVLN